MRWHLIKRHKDIVADALAFLPGFIVALAALAAARLDGDRSQAGFLGGDRFAMVLPVLCGLVSLVLLRGRTRSFDVAGMLDRLDDMQLYVWLAFAGIAIGSLLCIFFLMLAATIMF